MVSAFLRPVANRVASKEARAPEANRPVNRAASSTVTGPVPAVAAPGPGEAGGRPVQERALADEGLGERGDAGHELAREVLGEVHGVRAEVAERAGARVRFLQPPGERERRIGEPVLEVVGADVAQGADAPVGDHAAGERDGRDAPVVEADHRQLAVGGCPFGGLGHRLRLLHRVGERLLAQHVLAGLQGGDGDLGVAVARGADVDQVDVVPGDQRPPVGLGGGPAEPVGRGAHPRGVAAADRGECGRERQVEDVAHGAPALRVGGAHERVPDHADTQDGPSTAPAARLPVRVRASRADRAAARACHAEVLLVRAVFAATPVVRAGLT